MKIITSKSLSHNCYITQSPLKTPVKLTVQQIHQITVTTSIAFATCLTVITITLNTKTTIMNSYDTKISPALPWPVTVMTTTTVTTNIVIQSNHQHKLTRPAHQEGLRGGWHAQFFTKIVAIEVPGRRHSLVMKIIAQQIIFNTGIIRIF